MTNEHVSLHCIIIKFQKHWARSSPKAPSPSLYCNACEKGLYPTISIVDYTIWPNFNFRCN